MLRKLVAHPVVSFLLDLIAVCRRVGISRSAAALSYFLILSLFPLLLCLSGLVGRFHLDLRELLLSLDYLLPPDVLTLLTGYVEDAAQASSAPLWAGALTLLVSASAGLRALLLTMDQIFRTEARHPAGGLLASLLLSGLLLLTIYLSIAAVCTGGWFFRFLLAHVPIRVQPLPAPIRLWRWLRWLLLFSLFLLLVLGIYCLGTPRSSVSYRAVLTASLCTALAVAVGSALFSLFLSFSSRYDLVYGSLASLILLLVWLYACGTLLLLGAAALQVWARRNRSLP